MNIAEQDWKFDQKINALVVYDTQGTQYRIRGADIRQANSMKPSSTTGDVFDILNGEKFEEYNHMFGFRLSLGNIEDHDLKLVEVPNSKRMFLHVGNSWTSPPVNAHVNKDSFLQPWLLKLDDKTFLIKHQQSMDDSIHEVIISKVSIESKEIWSIHKRDLVPPRLMKKPYNFYVTPFKDQLFLLWGKLGAKEFSIAKVSAETGKVLTSPSYFKNKKFNLAPSPAKYK